MPYCQFCVAVVQLRIFLTASLTAPLVTSLIFGALLLLAFLLSFASLTPCIVFVALAMLSWMFCGILATHIVCPGSSAGKVWLMYFVGALLIIVVGYYVIPPMYMQAVGGISAAYMGQTVTVQSALEEITKNVNSVFAEEGVESFGELYGKVIENMFEKIASEI